MTSAMCQRRLAVGKDGLLASRQRVLAVPSEKLYSIRRHRRRRRRRLVFGIQMSPREDVSLQLSAEVQRILHHMVAVLALEEGHGVPRIAQQGDAAQRDGRRQQVAHGDVASHALRRRCVQHLSEARVDGRTLLPRELQPLGGRGRLESVVFPGRVVVGPVHDPVVPCRLLVGCDERDEAAVGAQDEVVGVPEAQPAFVDRSGEDGAADDAGDGQFIDARVVREELLANFGGVGAGVG
jgi:hypothetical protein